MLSHESKRIKNAPEQDHPQQSLLRDALKSERDTHKDTRSNKS
jgi:hypothetical protein